MADILIRGMAMPTCCLKCPLNSDSVCLAIDGCTYDNTNGTSRRGDCPLVPLPEGHGRLIDAEAIMTNIGEVPYKGSVRRVLMSAPTIVPAEGGKADDN